MTQLSTTAVSRFQFRNRVSFQEYSSFTHKSDFLSKMFLDFCQTEIPGSLQKVTPIPRLCSEERPAEMLYHGELRGLLPDLGAREEGQGLPHSSSWLSAARPQLVRRSTETLRLHSGRK